MMIALLVFASVSMADTIDFDSFALGAFAGGNEDGYTISATNGRVWNGFGFPTRSVGTFDANQTATFTITGPSLFNFNGFDLVRPDFTPSGNPVTARGYVGAVLVAQDVFAIPGVVSTPTAYGAINLAGIGIDRLVLSTTSSSASTTLIDNVDVDPVPEPGTYTMFGLALAGYAIYRRRRAA